MSILAAATLVCAGCGGEPVPKDLCGSIGKADFPWPGEPTAKHEEDSCSWSAAGYSVAVKRMPDIPLEALRKSWNLKEPAKSLGGREVFVRKSGYDLRSADERAIECRAAMKDGSGVVTLQVRNDDTADLCADVTRLAEKVARHVPG